MPVDEIRSELKLVYELTARIDERVKLMIEKQQEMTSRLNEFIDAHNLLVSRVSVLESKNGNHIYKVDARINELIERLTFVEVESPINKIKLEEIEEDLISNKDKIEQIKSKINKLEDDTNSLWRKIKQMVNLVIQGAWVIAVCYLLYKLGLQAPLVP